MYEMISYGDTRNVFYKGQRENETSPSLSKIRCCHCCIYDVIASLLLNKAPKIETSVPYKGVPYKKYCVQVLRPRPIFSKWKQTWELVQIPDVLQETDSKQVLLQSDSKSTLSIFYKGHLYKGHQSKFWEPYLVTVTL